MRYFLDTEFDGFGGRLISLALVPEDGAEELYLVIRGDVTDPWVQRHVMPFIDHVPEALKCPPLERLEAAEAVWHWLEHDASPEIIADWPEDLAQFSMLLVIGPGKMVPVPPLILRFAALPGFSTAVNSAVPHNALHDARALRDHFVTNHLE